MELIIALIIGVLTTSGVFLTLRGHTFPVVLGLTLLAYAVNVFLFAMGRLTIGLPAVIDPTQAEYADPLPQALVLTAIVIAFGMTAFLIVLALKSRSELGNDHVDGQSCPEGEIPVETDVQKQIQRNEQL
ncbi:Na+/H+ antiporter subunit C [Thiomicrorhabdus chilensis]|uniref:Na+/H+ antiporter subunit C n=1 Tax=Thiomicrorhabdus chilensis TaxID=63656 RepID=UPI0003F627C7|nr:Na+/H+ antiporter subunit C [Thiomicrorhabdus chilensis]